MAVLARLFNRQGKPDAMQAMRPREAAAIIQEFGAVLEFHAPAPGCVADTSKLPYSKQRIKDAVILGLYMNRDLRVRELLKGTLLALADWQDGVGEIDQGSDLLNADLNGAPHEVAKAVAALAEYQEKWETVISAEREALKRELVKLGLW
jgi:hypothetical protein